MTDSKSPASHGYTPGPWEIEYDNDTGPRDESFAEWYEVGPARVMIDRRSPEASAMAKRDAALISAALEMRKALIEVHDFILLQYGDAESQALEGETVSREARQVWNSVCAALAKAEDQP